MTLLFNKCSNLIKKDWTKGAEKTTIGECDAHARATTVTTDGQRGGGDGGKGGSVATSTLRKKTKEFFFNT